MCDENEIPPAENQAKVSLSKSKSKMVLYIDALIREVKKRPILWDKRHNHYGCRTKVNKSWLEVAAAVQRGPEEVKAKWRNLKDSFHRLEKRIELPPDDEGKPLSSYYTGQWVHFKKLLFLKDTRSMRTSNEDFIEADVPDICVDGIKGEFDLSENSRDSDEIEKSDEVEKIFTEPAITLHGVFNAPNLISNPDPNISESRNILAIESDSQENKIRLLDLPETKIDEDLHFVKSLVPFLRRLNPIRKLIVRNEMQNLLIKEMLCENCKSFGPQPNCRCNMS